MENKKLNITMVSCSGASNTGCYADRVSRILTESGQTDMICLPKIAINDKKLIEKCKNTTATIVVIDGCPLNCAKKILEDHGITNFVHINTTDFGIQKGKTPLMDDKINEMITYIKSLDK
jgi:uncharacterized metal-binding protein